MGVLLIQLQLRNIFLGLRCFRASLLSLLRNIKKLHIVTLLKLFKSFFKITTYIIISLILVKKYKDEVGIQEL